MLLEVSKPDERGQWGNGASSIPQYVQTLNNHHTIHLIDSYKSVIMLIHLGYFSYEQGLVRLQIEETSKSPWMEVLTSSLHRTWFPGSMAEQLNVLHCFMDVKSLFEMGNYTVHFFLLGEFQVLRCPIKLHLTNLVLTAYSCFSFSRLNTVQLNPDILLDMIWNLRWATTSLWFGVKNSAFWESMQFWMIFRWVFFGIWSISLITSPVLLYSVQRFNFDWWYQETAILNPLNPVEFRRKLSLVSKSLKKKIAFNFLSVAL